jgi:hypothetical protein
LETRHGRSKRLLGLRIGPISGTRSKRQKRDTVTPSAASIVSRVTESELNQEGSIYENDFSYICAHVPTLVAPTIAWTPPSTSNVGGTSDLTINYTKADPNSTVVAIGISTDMNNIGAAFYCAGTPGADGSGSITIPAGILGGLPASVPASSTGGGFTVPPGFLLVGTSTTTKETTPTGLDALYLTTVNASGQTVLFQ